MRVVSRFSPQKCVLIGASVPGTNRGRYCARVRRW